MSRPVTVTAWHPYPTFRWEYKTATTAWQAIDGSDPGGTAYTYYVSGWSTATVLLADDVPVGGEATLRCIIGSPGNEVVESAHVSITVSAPLNWDTDLAGETKTIEATIPELLPDWGTGILDQSTTDGNWPQTLDLDNYCDGATSYNLTEGEGVINGSILTVDAPGSIPDTYNYTIQAVNAAGSAPTSFTWERVGVVASIDVPPEDVFVVVPGPATYSLVASHPEDAPLYYNWMAELDSSSGLFNVGTLWPGRVSGENTDTFTLDPTEAGDDARVLCRTRAYVDDNTYQVLSPDARLDLAPTYEFGVQLIEYDGGTGDAAYGYDSGVATVGGSLTPEGVYTRLVSDWPANGPTGASLRVHAPGNDTGGVNLFVKLEGLDAMEIPQGPFGGGFRWILFYDDNNDIGPILQAIVDANNTTIDIQMWHPPA